MKATKLPSGNWRCRVCIGTDASGKRHWKSVTAPTKARAERDAAAIQVEYDIEEKSIDKSSLSQAAARFISQHESVLSPSTIKAYVSICRSIERYDKGLWEASVYRIGTSDVQKLIDTMAHEGLSAKTIHNVNAFISAVLTSCDVQLRHPKLPKKVRTGMDIPDISTVQQILEAVRGTDLEVPVMLAAFGSMRRGEICALEMEDIEGNVAHVHNDMVLTKDNVWVVKPPKTYASDRYIELPDFVIEAIQQKGCITDKNPACISKNYKTALRRAGIPHYTFHALRHFSISYMHALGIPDIYIMQRSGHATSNVLRSVYTHTLQDHSQVETKKILDSFVSQFRVTNASDVSQKATK